MARSIGSSNGVSSLTTAVFQSWRVSIIGHLAIHEMPQCLHSDFNSIAFRGCGEEEGEPLMNLNSNLQSAEIETDKPDGGVCGLEWIRERGNQHTIPRLELGPPKNYRIGNQPRPLRFCMVV